MNPCDDSNFTSKPLTYVSGKPLMTVQEAADLMQVHQRTVERMCRDGRIKAVKCGRAWRINSAELLRALSIA